MTDTVSPPNHNSLTRVEPHIAAAPPMSVEEAELILRNLEVSYRQLFKSAKVGSGGAEGARDG